MKKFSWAALAFLGSAFVTAAITIEFDLSPPGHGRAVGLSPLNGVIPGASHGSGDEIGRGIWFDTETRTLSLSFGYGSVAGFTDLTGAAFAVFLHGPATVDETAPVLFSLQSLHTFAPESAHGGTVIGSIVLGASEVSGLLSGLDYINLYTTQNLGGEIRGQLVPVTTAVPDAGAGTLALTAVALAGLLVLRHRRLGAA